MILGHKKQWDILRKLAKEKKLPHALLFSGPEKLGKKKVAFRFVSLLFHKDVERTAHPDFVFIEPSPREIQISQIRELAKELSLKNFSAPLKAAVLDRAHLMNLQAQNCLLKTLEEPKTKAVIILITEHPKVLLPTIISRCQTIRFYPLGEKEIENYLISKGASPDKAKEISQVSLGQPGFALDLFSRFRTDSQCKALSDLIEIFRKPLAFRFQYINNKLSEEPLPVLKLWLRYLRNILILQLSNKTDGEFKRFEPQRIKEFLEVLQKTIFFLETKNVNRKLTLENLMLSFDKF